MVSGFTGRRHDIDALRVIAVLVLLVYLNRPSRWLPWAGARVYPFYIWHQTVIVLLAFFVIRVEGPALVKCLILIPLSLVMTLALCEVLSLTSLTRAMFGMRLKARGAHAARRPAGVAHDHE